MNGKLIPNDDIKNLPVGTKLLVHCLDENFWLVCTLADNDYGLHLLDDDIAGGVLTYLDDIDFLETYEFNEEDRIRLVKKDKPPDPVEMESPYADSHITKILSDVRDEINRAISKFGPFNSSHEGYAVLLEEVDELWDEVKKNQNKKSKEHMREEAIQVAAMACRFIIDIC